jgi:hypothetical protein
MPAAKPVLEPEAMWMTRLSPETGEMVSYREPNRKCEGEGPFSHPDLFLLA